MKKRRGARLGQHFLNAAWVARDLVASLEIAPEETILEIGPGRGMLTERLLEEGRLVAIEKDPELAAFLREKFKSEIASGRFTLVEDDVRNITPESLALPPGYVVAANIPYYITGEIIRRLLSSRHQPRAIALLIQKEVARRIVARDKKESILSLSVKAYGTPSIIAKVPRSCFNPAPSVDSAILLVKNISWDFFEDVSEETFFTTVRNGFSSKRKLLANNLSKMGDGHSAIAACSLAEKTRAEDLALPEWKCLALKLSRP